MLVRRLVSGVRSSWPASATSWRCCTRERLSASSISLKLVASRATSSRPCTSIDAERSWVCGDVLRGVGQPPDRPQRGPGDEQPERGGERDAAEPGEDEPQAEVREVAVDLGERAGELHRDARRGRHGDDPHVLALHRSRRAGASRPSRPRPRGRAASTGMRPRLVRGPRRRAVRADELHHRLLARRAASRGSGRAPGRRTAESLIRSAWSVEPLVDLAAELVAHADVGVARGEQHRDRDRGGRREREPHPQAHATSRSTYPTPRTVRIRRGSPPASVLRRR